MAANEGPSGVSSSIFKNLLLEYANKLGLPEPVYEFVEEGPSHEHYVRSTVVVNGVKYYSMPGFPNRKAAQQSAAEVALMELARSSGDKKHIYATMHESGICKRMLRDYVAKMNYAAPIYETNESKKDAVINQELFFSSTVEIEGARYTGGAGRTKKEAETKAASTALFSIHPSLLGDGSRLTLFPGKREIESVKDLGGTPSALKPKKAGFKRKNKMAIQNLCGVLGMEEARLVKSHTNGELQTVASNGDQSNLLGLKEAPSALKPKGELQAVKGQLVEASNGDQSNLSGLKEVLSAPEHGELQTVEGQLVASNGDQSNLSGLEETWSALKPNKAKGKKKKKATQNSSGVLGAEEARVEGTPTPHTNGELQTHKEQSVASNGDQSNNPSGSGETPSALKPKKANRKKNKMATQNPSGVLGTEEAAPTPHNNNQLQASKGVLGVEEEAAPTLDTKLQTPKEQSVGTPTPHTNEELQTLSISSNGDQSNPSSLKETPNALKPKKAKCKKKKKVATQNPSGVLGMEKASQSVAVPTPHTNGEAQSVGAPHTSVELGTQKEQPALSNGDQQSIRICTVKGQVAVENQGRQDETGTGS